MQLIPGRKSNSRRRSFGRMYFFGVACSRLHFPPCRARWLFPRLLSVLVPQSNPGRGPRDLQLWQVCVQQCNLLGMWRLKSIPFLPVHRFSARWAASGVSVDDAATAE